MNQAIQPALLQDPVIQTETIGRVGVIRLNRPKKRNAINGAMMVYWGTL